MNIMTEVVVLIFVPQILTLAREEGEWTASCSSHFTSGAYCIGGWVGPRVSPDLVA